MLFWNTVFLEHVPVSSGRGGSGPVSAQYLGGPVSAFGEQTERAAKTKNKIKSTPRIPAAASYVCWLPRESTAARNPFPYDIPGRPCRFDLVS